MQSTPPTLATAQPISTLSPLALPFELASQPLRFLEQIRLSAEDEIRAEIQSVSTKPLGLALAGAKFAMEKGQLQVVFKNLGKRADHAESVLESVNWMHFTLLLQLALSAKAGRADRFLSITLADEAATWDSLAKHTTRRALEISGKTAMPKQWDPLLDHLRGLAQVWTLETRIPTIQ